MNRTPYKLTNSKALRNKTLLDLVMIPLSLVVVYSLSSYWNLSEKYMAWAAEHEHDLNIDELPLALLASLSAMAWFSARRFQEIQELLKLNHQLLHHATRAQEDERRKIAQDLHDDLGQYLNAIRIESKNIMNTNTISEDIKSTAQRISDHSSHAYNTTKKLMHKLRPVALDDLGLSAALKHLIDTWQTPTSQTKFLLEMTGKIDNINTDIEIDIYRVIQECLTNIARHALAKNVHILIQATDGDMKVTVTDDGIGISRDHASTGFGLAGMRERIESHNGTFSIHSASGKGTSIMAKIPLNN